MTKYEAEKTIRELQIITGNDGWIMILVFAKLLGVIETDEHGNITETKTLERVINE